MRNVIHLDVGSLDVWIVSPLQVIFWLRLSQPHFFFGILSE